jgi:ubiquinone/menaquinone biosynthesis C-methylase UbiE
VNSATVISEQRLLWSTNPRDWSEIAEPQNRPLFAQLLDVTEVRPGTRLLDIACGSGFAAALAAARGAHVSGVDIAPALLAIACERTPGADFREGQMDELPFADALFDVVFAVNGFQFALDPQRAVKEAGRVLVPAGRLAAATFAEPDRNEGTVIHLAMKTLVEDGGDDGYAPYALSSAEGLKRVMEDAGIEVIQSGELPVTWSYPDTETTLRAFLASAGGARAVRAAGADRVRAVITQAITPFHDASGAVSIRNLFRYVVGVKR